MSKKIIIHIGRHKSGTTSLQTFFSCNKEELISAGIYYPEIGTRDGAHHLISELILDRTVKGVSISDVLKENLMSRFLNEITSVKEEYILISSEGFQNISPSIVRKTFQEFEVYIVVYFREQLSYLKSSYQQEVHATNLCCDILEFEKTFKVNFLEFYHEWEREFGKKNVIVRIFDRRYLVNSDVVDDFFVSILNEKFSLFPSVKQPSLDVFTTNLSLSGRCLSFKLRFNKFFPVRQNIPNYLYYYLAKFSEKEKNINYVPDDLVNELIEKYRESNLMLMDELGLDKSFFEISKPDTFQELNLLGPKQFLKIFLEIIAVENRFKECLSRFYSYSQEPFDGIRKLVFCDNINLDSISYIYFCVNGVDVPVMDMCFFISNELWITNDNFKLVSSVKLRFDDSIFVELAEIDGVNS
ncbi:hypothetical protein [Marinomonas shanghaiensis]|uniref:hypothetical protein n=1 Tax=Marinomonas shanghaiensis TaxID=2202418 RepID=UPI003A9309FC